MPRTIKAEKPKMRKTVADENIRARLAALEAAFMATLQLLVLKGILDPNGITPLMERAKLVAWIPTLHSTSAAQVAGERGKEAVEKLSDALYQWSKAFRQARDDTLPTTG